MDLRDGVPSGPTAKAAPDPVTPEGNVPVTPPSSPGPTGTGSHCLHSNRHIPAVTYLFNVNALLS